MRRLLLVAVILLILAGASAADGRRDPERWQWQYRVWMPAHWQRLAACESGSTPPNWRHHSYYQGAFGFAPGSWDQFKPAGWWPADAHLASPWQQWRVARRIAARYGLAEPWGCWRGPQHAWVRGGLPEYGTYR